LQHRRDGQLDSVSALSAGRAPAPSWIAIDRQRPAEPGAVPTVLAGGWFWNSAPPLTRASDAAYSPARTIAVMPFDNAGGDAEVQFLCDGIAESLINWLATVIDL
jgi:hypothetical protein